ncbi:hypothetical protein IAU59_005399 [Kwoniella sp. CBS 9459]
MSFSVVFSPPTVATSNAAEPIASTSRPQRSTRTTASYASSPRENTLSPSPPSRSAAMSTRSRRSFSSSLSHPERSPDKRSISSRDSRRTKDRSPIKSSDTPKAALGLILGELQHAADGVAHDSDLPHEEGEEEVDLDIEENEGPTNEVDDAELEVASIDSQRDSEYTPTRQRITSPDKAKLTESSKKVIRLVFGKKRKAEEVDKPDESEKEDDPLEQDEELTGTEADELVRQKVEAQKHEPAVEGSRGDAPKRMPRKKRKWLKKGEVDPDDPVAVARQKERHRMIDEAIESLDKQEEMLLANSHPQLVWLWDELERRKDTQLTWLDARHDATVGDLEKLREHEKKVTRSNFKVKREELALNMLADNRHALERMFAERTMLKRNPSNRPNLRAGRGAGGWPIAATNLLSNGELKTVSVEINDEIRSRRDISRAIQPLEFNEIESDLAKLGLIRGESRTRSVSPRRSRHSGSGSSKTAEGRRTTGHSRRHEQATAPPAPQPSAPSRPISLWEQPLPEPRPPPPKPSVPRVRTPEMRPLPSVDRHHSGPRYEAPAPIFDHRSHPSHTNNVPSRQGRGPSLLPPKQQSYPPNRPEGPDYRFVHSLAFPTGSAFASGPPMPVASQSSNYYRYPKSMTVSTPSLGVPPQA